MACEPSGFVVCAVCPAESGGDAGSGDAEMRRETAALCSAAEAAGASYRVHPCASPRDLRAAVLGTPDDAPDVLCCVAHGSHAIVSSVLVGNQTVAMPLVAGSSVAEYDACSLVKDVAQSILAQGRPWLLTFSSCHGSWFAARLARELPPKLMPVMLTFATLVQGGLCAELVPAFIGQVLRSMGAVPADAAYDDWMAAVRSSAEEAFASATSDAIERCWALVDPCDGVVRGLVNESRIGGIPVLIARVPAGELPHSQAPGPAPCLPETGGLAVPELTDTVARAIVQRVAQHAAVAGRTVAAEEPHLRIVPVMHEFSSTSATDDAPRIHVRALIACSMPHGSDPAALRQLGHVTVARWALMRCLDGDAACTPALIERAYDDWPDGSDVRLQVSLQRLLAAALGDGLGAEFAKDGDLVVMRSEDLARLLHLQQLRTRSGELGAGCSDPSPMRTSAPEPGLVPHVAVLPQRPPISATPGIDPPIRLPPPGSSRLRTPMLPPTGAGATSGVWRSNPCSPGEESAAPFSLRAHAHATPGLPAPGEAASSRVDVDVLVRVSVAPTPREATLPVAVIAIVDCSASAAASLDDGVSRIESFRRALESVLLRLRPCDHFGIVAFCGSADGVIVLPLQPLNQRGRDAAREAVAAGFDKHVGAGTLVCSGLATAVTMLEGCLPPVDHGAALLFCGSRETVATTSGALDALTARCKRGHLAVHAFCVTDDAAVRVLASVAAKTEGAVYAVPRAHALPSRATAVTAMLTRGVIRNMKLRVAAAQPGLALAGDVCTAYLHWPPGRATDSVNAVFAAGADLGTLCEGESRDVLFRFLVDFALLPADQDSVVLRIGGGAKIPHAAPVTAPVPLAAPAGGPGAAAPPGPPAVAAAESVPVALAIPVSIPQVYAGAEVLVTVNRKRRRRLPVQPAMPVVTTTTASGSASLSGSAASCTGRVAAPLLSPVLESPPMECQCSPPLPGGPEQLWGARVEYKLALVVDAVNALFVPVPHHCVDDVFTRWPVPGGASNASGVGGSPSPVRYYYGLARPLAHTVASLLDAHGALSAAPGDRAAAARLASAALALKLQRVWITSVR